MYKIVFSTAVARIVNRYSQKYREYFDEIYSDTGIWSEAQIRKQYEDGAIERRKEIAHLLTEKLSQDPILGRNSDTSAVIGWRSKILLVSWCES